MWITQPWDMADGLKMPRWRSSTSAELRALCIGRCWWQSRTLCEVRIGLYAGLFLGNTADESMRAICWRLCVGGIFTSPPPEYIDNTLNVVLHLFLLPTVLYIYIWMNDNLESIRRAPYFLLKRQTQITLVAATSDEMPTLSNPSSSVYTVWWSRFCNFFLNDLICWLRSLYA